MIIIKFIYKFPKRTAQYFFFFFYKIIVIQQTFTPFLLKAPFLC